jgi:hypothetical protein
MPNNWQKVYDALKDYIAKNPSIEISSSVVAIPGDIRPEFYRLFDTIRVNFIKDNFPTELEKSYALSKHWAETSQYVINNMKLEAIEIQASVRWFLLDPINGLMRGLFDPLFDLFKGRTTLNLFEQTAAQIVKDDFTKFFREGYQRWAEVALIKLLAADKVYSVPAADYNTDASMMEGDPSGGLREEGVPEPVETHKIAFEISYMCSFLSPRIILHSTKLNRFISFRPEFYEARWKARLLSEYQEWYSIRAIEKEFGQTQLWPELAVYLSDDLVDLMVVADYHKVARPDIIVDFKEDHEWFSKEGLELVKRHHDVLKPKLGSFVICREPAPEAAIKGLEPKPVIQAVSTSKTATPEPEQVIEPKRNVSIISAGYDITKLEAVVEAMLNAGKKTT